VSIPCFLEHFNSYRFFVLVLYCFALFGWQSAVYVVFPACSFPSFHFYLYIWYSQAEN